VPPMNGPIPISPWRMRNLKLLATTVKSMPQSAVAREISPGIA
jgi:hypothetical protein